MVGSQQDSWSNDPNRPKISHSQYIQEKGHLAGNLIGLILYGIFVAVFLQCMAALFNPFHRRGEPIKWGLVSYTIAMFSVATISAGMSIRNESVAYIDDREFPGIKGVLPPGPLGYRQFTSSKALEVIPTAMFALSNWLADGLLLYRCYVVCAMNLWIIAFPCLMYFVSLATGIMLIYQSTQLTSNISSGLPYFSISLSLNVLLTLMIATRLILHARNTRIALGIIGIGGLCKAAVTMLIESCALNAASSLLVLGWWSTIVEGTFPPILAETRVIAPLLIIQRVANKNAFAKNTVVSGRLSSFPARRSMDGSSTTPGGGYMSSVDEREMNSDELRVRAETTIDFN